MSTCATCRYYDGEREPVTYASGKIGPGFGVCRRRAPMPAVIHVPDVQVQPVTYWPSVRANEWCGEWEEEKK